MLLKYALRNIKKRFALNFIKVVGLSLGLCGVLFIALFLKNEMTYDSGHSKADCIHRLTITSPNFAKGNHFARVPDSKIIPELYEQIPEIETAVRLMPLRDKLILQGEQHYSINQAFAVDTSFLEIFDIVFEEGDANALSAPGNAIISRSLAQNIFGEENPIGQVISLPPGHFNSLETAFTIRGVMEDFAQQNHLHPDLLVMPGKDAISGWAYVYLLLREKTSAPHITDKLSQKLNELYGIEIGDASEAQVHLMNIKEIHLKSDLLREIEHNGNMTHVYMLGIAALMLLFISLSNFTSLNLGMAGYLTKFLSLNQILGSSKRIMTRYFLIESAIIVITALILVVFVSLKLNGLISENYQINLFEKNGWFVTGIMVAFSLLGILAGIQPVIKNRFGNFALAKSIKGQRSVSGHKVLLVSQFALAIILVVGVIVISKQTNYALDQGMAATEDNVLCIPFVHSEIQKDFAVFKSSLLEQSAIESVSSIMAPPGGETNDMFAFDMQDVPNEKEKFIGVFACDYSFLDVFELPFLSGENFTEKSRDEEGNGEYIINETALHYLGFKDANTVVGKDFALISPVDGVTLPKGRIIGVIKDFHLSGLRTKVEPLVLFKKSSWLQNITISYAPDHRKEALATIRKSWANLFPSYPLEYFQVSALYKNVYRTELLQKKLILIFAIIAIFVCAMGLLGLSLMVSQRRFKEIGIRKVNGAKISEILMMLNTDFLRLVLFAFVLATPIAYLLVKKWLETFAYKIEVNLYIFILAGGIVTLVTAFTVSWHSYRAARQNPVKSLRTE
ncbi:ABC transporter permease [Maribacter sp. 2210JD10-5]|uniref:ABC transporter permease n=1 Tax=Maribacter sp. 2210JD10-5 TaxID=3386272 RepID=UPI0039BC715C